MSLANSTITLIAYPELEEASLTPGASPGLSRGRIST